MMPTPRVSRAIKRRIHDALAVCGLEVVRDKSRLRLRRRFYLGANYLKDIGRIAGGAKNIRTCIDGGAHWGETALALADAFPRATIYSFEPEKDNYQALLAACACRRIVPVPMALGESTADGTFIVNEDSQTGSLLAAARDSGKYVHDPAGMRPAATETVPVVALSDWAAQNGVDSIDLLKLDLQGYELKALEGSRSLLGRKKILFIYLEVNFVPAYDGQAPLGALYDYCTSMGYRLVGLYPNEFNASKFHYRCGGDLLFVLEDLSAFARGA
jgi:FkbM family methyltransferase